MPIIAQDSPYRGWAMQGEAMLVLTLMVFAAGVAIVIFVLWLNRRHARARQRLDLLGEALENPQVAQKILYERPDEFKSIVRGFQRLNYQDEHTSYAAGLEHDLGIALICALLDGNTRELVSDLGLNYL